MHDVHADRVTRQITPRDAGKVTRMFPGATLQKVAEEGEAERQIFGAEEEAHDQELNEAVDDVEYFNGEVQEDQVDSRALTEPQTRHPSAQAKLQSFAAVFPLCIHQLL